ncbi:MAG: multicopper oxidase domain-containing protein [Bacteroidota bacterium]|nr:multicopper oxidase domain-containing protein [Bacteroidota bacterium]
MKKSFTIIIALTLFFNFSRAQNLLAIPDTLSGTNFNLNIYDTSKVFYTGYTTNTFGVNGKYLGPTVFLNKWDSVSMNVFNQLMDTTTIHWHGLHVSAKNDGGPEIFIPPNTTWNPKFKVRDHAATYWYHPHLHMMTNLHVSLGAAGLIIVRDSAERALNLPRKYGVDDFPLVLQTKCFNTTKQILINNASDSVVMVNGTLKAYLPTPAQVVRFRVLNASSERVYNIGLQGNLTFYQIGSDGGLLNAPLALTRLRLAPGERAELLVDFTGKMGQSINLMSFASELPSAIYGATQPGMGAGQVIPGYSTNVLNGANFNLMTFSVVAQTPSPVTTVPSTLVINNPWSVTNANGFKTLTFTPVNMGPTAIQGPFLINNTSFNMNVVNYSIPLNNIEVWTLTNQSPIAHPFHIHDVQFYITEYNGGPAPSYLAGRKDVVLVPAGQTVKFITKFETFCDSTEKYMYHCHMLPHEDAGMMGQFVVTCPINVGIEEIDYKMEDIILYPNPTSDKIKIKSNAYQPISEITIFDNLGKVILSKNKLLQNENEFDLITFPSGFYLIEIKTSKGIIYKKLNLIK